MKGARRVRKPRQQAGFADLVAPSLHPSTNMRGVVTGLSHAQSTTSTPVHNVSAPTTPPPPEEDWGALLQTTPKRRMSPRKPISANTTPSSSSSTRVSPKNPSRQRNSMTPILSPPLSKMASPSPSKPIYASSNQPSPRTPSPKPPHPKTPSPSNSSTVPAFLSGWDGADGWGDDPSLDDSDPEANEDGWGTWPESDDLLSSQVNLSTSTPSIDHAKRTHPQKEELLAGSPTGPGQETASDPSQDQSNERGGPESKTIPVLSGEAVAGNLQTSSPHLLKAEIPDQTSNSPKPVDPNESYRENATTKVIGTDAYVISTNQVEESITHEIESSVEEPKEPETVLSAEEPVGVAALDTSDELPEVPPTSTDTSEESRPEHHPGNENASNSGSTEPTPEDVVYFPARRAESLGQQSDTTRDGAHLFEAQSDSDLMQQSEDKAADAVLEKTKDQLTQPASAPRIDGQVHQDAEPAVSNKASAGQSSDSQKASLPANNWEFEDGFDKVPANEVGWGWGDNEDTSFSNVEDVNVVQPTVDNNSTISPQEILAEPLKQSSSIKPPSSGDQVESERVTGVTGSAVEVSSSCQKSSPKTGEADLFVAFQPSAAAEFGWGFAEDSKEASADGWGWGTQEEQGESEFTIEVKPPAEQETAPKSTPLQQVSVQGPEDSPSENREAIAKEQNLDEEIRRQPNEFTTGGSNCLLEAPTHYEQNPSDSNSPRPFGIQGENDYSPVPGNCTSEKTVREKITLDSDISIQKDRQHLNEESARVNGSVQATEEDAWSVDIRSTDVDVSSTIAGTDVPSVAAQSSVDDTEWEADRTDFGFDASSTLGMVQNREKRPSPPSDSTSTLQCNGNDAASETNRLWADPDAMWSSSQMPSHLPIVSHDNAGQSSIRGQSASPEADAGKKILLHKESAAVNRTMIDSVEKSPLQSTPKDSLPADAAEFPSIGLDKFAHCREDHQKLSAGRNYVSNEQGDAKMPKFPEEAIEGKSVACDFQNMHLKSEEDVQFFPNTEQEVGTQGTNSSNPQRGDSSNTYWTERLDQTKTQAPKDGRDKTLFPSPDEVTNKSEELAVQTEDLATDTVKGIRNSILNEGIAGISNYDSVVMSSTGTSQQLSAEGRASGIIFEPSDEKKTDHEPGSAPHRVPDWEFSQEHLADANASSKLEYSAANGPDGSDEARGMGGTAEVVVENGTKTILGGRSEHTISTQDFKWSSDNFALTKEEAYHSNRWEEAPNVSDSQFLTSHAHQSQPGVAKYSNSDALDSGTGAMSNWSKYAPRVSPKRTQDLPPEHTFEESFPKPAHQLSGASKPQDTVSSSEIEPRDLSSYDPFSVTESDLTGKPANASYEAFDWNVGEQASAFDVEILQSPSSPATQPSSLHSASRLPKRNFEENIAETSKPTIGVSHTHQNETIAPFEVQQDLPTSDVGEPQADIQQSIEQDESNYFSGGQVGPHSHFQEQGIDKSLEEVKEPKRPDDTMNHQDVTQETASAHQRFEQYAPRSAEAKHAENSTRNEDSTRVIGQESFGARDNSQKTDSFLFTMDSTDVTSSTNFAGDHQSSDQAVSTSAAPPHDQNAFYAPSETAVIPQTLSKSEEFASSQSHYNDREVFSSQQVGLPVLPKPIQGKHVPNARPFEPTPQDISSAGETIDPYSSIEVAPEASAWGQHPAGSQKDHSFYAADSFSYAPIQGGSYQQIGGGAGLEKTEISQSESPQDIVERTASISGEKQNMSSSPIFSEVAYGVASAVQGREKSIVPTPTDKVAKEQDSLNLARQADVNFDLAPPPPPPPVAEATSTPPFPMPYYQEENAPESIVDPLAFSYPYSIMDAEPSGEVGFRRPRPVISWGFGGQLVTVIPSNANTSNDLYADDYGTTDVKGSSTVQIYNMASIAQVGFDDDWAAASEVVSPLSLPVRPPDLLTYADMCDRLAQLSVGLSGSQAEGRAAMWRVLALLCREGTSDWRRNASAALCGPAAVPMFGKNDNSLVLSGNCSLESPLRTKEPDSEKSKEEKREASGKVERLLAEGHAVEALHVAQNAGLWSIALVLASTLDKSLYKKALSEFAKSTLRDGSALQTLCLSTAEDEAAILSKVTSPSGLKEWRKTIGMLLNTHIASSSSADQHNRFVRLVNQIGEALIAERKDTVAGHVCFLISGRIGPLDGNHFPLLGADSAQPAGRPRSLGSPAPVLQSMVLEAIANAQEGARFPHILPFRLLLAEHVCSVGRPDVALAHCESVSHAVRGVFEAGSDLASKIFTPPFLSRLESLEHRLRVHLGKQEDVEKKGALTALGKSLTSVFTRSSTVESRKAHSTQMVTGELQAKELQYAVPQGSPPPMPAAYTSHQSSPPAVPLVNSQQDIPEPQWGPKLEQSQFQPSSVDQSTMRKDAGAQSADLSGNERWNSLVSKTIGFIAPAEGDLSPPLKARGDGGVPFHAQPTPLGLGTGIGSGAASHMRSASVGDFPRMHGQETMTTQHHGHSKYSNVAPYGSQNQSQHHSDPDGKTVTQAFMNGVPVQKATAADSGLEATHRRSASDMTFESQTSEKKPPRPPKRSSAVPKGVEQLAKLDKAPAVKGWRSRLSEKIRAAFSGTPRAHMGVENKFRYDEERKRWVIDGADPDEDDDVPPPPPDDDAMPENQGNVPFSQSYESLPNPDLREQYMSHSHVADSAGTTNLGRYAANTQLGHRGSADNISTRDAGSESSAASAASAPVPYSAQPGIPVSANPGNKFRAQPGRFCGRRAYVDTFNKGPSASSMSPALSRPTRPMPRVPGLGSSSASRYRIFTPSPATSTESQSALNPNMATSDGVLGTSGKVEADNEMFQKPEEVRTSNPQQPYDSFGYGLSNDAPVPSNEQYQGTARNDLKPRLMA